MRKLRFGFIFLLTIIFSIILAGCAQDTKTSKEEGAANSNKAADNKNEEVTLKVGSAAVPHAEILEFIKPKLKEEGINLEIIVLDSDGELNPALFDKQIDANFFQHVPYLESVNEEKGYELVPFTKVHVEPIGLYSEKLKSIDDVKDGAKIGIPNNPSNEYRALILLEQQGLIKLRKDLATYEATPKDIVENPKNLEFIESEPPTLARALPDLDGAIINTNVVLEAGIDTEKAILLEDSNSPYANIVVIRKGEENDEKLKKLDAALTDPSVKKFIEDKYGSAVVPAF